MPSEIRVDTIKTSGGLGNVAVNSSGINVTGIVTATSFVGAGMSISGVATATSFNGVITSSASQTASGATVDFDIPSWAKRITMIWHGLSTTGTGLLLLRVLVDGTVLTSGYAGSGGGSTFTNGFTDSVSNAGAVRYGSLVLTKVSSTLWVANGGSGRSDAGQNMSIQGSVTISGTLTAVRFAGGGIDTFDSGTVGVMYEG